MTTHEINTKPFKSLELVEKLAHENQSLRQQLQDVSAVGITMMHHTHQPDCSFTRDFLKSVLTIAQKIEVQDVQHVFKNAYEFSTEPGVLQDMDLSMCGEFSD